VGGLKLAEEVDHEVVWTFGFEDKRQGGRCVDWGDGGSNCISAWSMRSWKGVSEKKSVEKNVWCCREVRKL
jgi:hypothetical protein